MKTKTNKEIKDFLNSIKDLNLSKSNKNRMLRLFQVEGSNKKYKIMTYKEFSSIMKNKKGKITDIVLGPNWNRLIFVNINIEI